MKLTFSVPHPGLTKISRHAVLIAVICALCFDSWIYWKGWQLWADQPLPSDRVTAKQLRVSESQRQTFIKSVITYQRPAAIPAVPNLTFDTGASN